MPKGMRMGSLLRMYSGVSLELWGLGREYLLLRGVEVVGGCTGAFWGLGEVLFG